MSYYRRIGRRHARQALKEFLASNDNLTSDCDCPSSTCVDCLKGKALEVFHDFQLREAMDPDSKFRSPPDKKSEQDYTDAALDLIEKTIERSSVHSNEKESMVMSAESAYNLGCEVMGDIVNEVSDALSPEDYEGDVKNNIKEKCWAMLEDKMGGETPVPQIHKMLKVYYDRGIHDTLEGIEPPAQAAQSTNILRFPRRASRYERNLSIEEQISKKGSDLC